MENRKASFLKSTLLLGIGTFFPKFAVFITLPILTAGLSTTEYGTYDLILTVFELLLPVVTLQIQSAAFRFLIDAHNDKSEKQKIISNIIAFTAPFIMVTITIMFFVLYKMTFAARIVICLYFAFYVISNVNKQIIRGLSYNKIFTVACFVGALMQIILAFAFVKVKSFGLVGAVLALAVAEAFVSVIMMIKGKIYQSFNIKYISKSTMKELIAYSWPMVPNSISQWVIHASDRLVISIFMGAAANAVYAVAYKIPSMLSFAQIVFNMSWQENASLSADAKDREKYFSEMFSSFFNVVSGCFAALIGITPVLFKILIEGDYDDAYIQIPILYMGVFFLCLSTFWGGIYVAIKDTKSVGITTVVAALCNLLIDLVAIKFIGLYAASISTLISYIVLTLYRAFDIQKKVKLKYNFGHIALTIIFLTVQCALCMMQKPMLNYINFIIGIIFAVIINLDFIKSVSKKIFKKLKH